MNLVIFYRDLGILALAVRKAAICTELTYHAAVMRREPRWTLVLRLLACWLGLFAGGGAALAADDGSRVNIIFSERPPQVEAVRQNDGSISYKGALYELVQEVVRRAGVNATFALVPQMRRDAVIRQNETDACAFGVYKTPERELFAQFTLPIAQDVPWPVISREDSLAALRPVATLKTFLANTRLHGVFLLGVSHGVYVDGLIAAMSGPMEKTGQTPVQLLKMLEVGHGDFTVLPADILEVYRREQPLTTLRTTYFPDVVGLHQYMMCSKRVSPEVVERLNAAIRALRR